MKCAVAVLTAPLLAFAGVLTLGVARQTDASACWVEVASYDGADPGERIDPAQVGNARIIVGVATVLGLAPRAAVIAVATAKQESDLRNLRYGDRDSLGLFQQRPSQGWGTPAQVLDPVYASTAFYQRLLNVPDWLRLPLTVAAQAVQRSAFPTAYARWEPLATRLVAHLTGGDPAGLGCRDEGGQPEAAGSDGPYSPEGMDPDGLTPRTRAAMVAVMAAFGVTDVGGFCPGGCTTGHIAKSDHYTGHAVDFMLLPINAANRRLGDAIAAWLVANADRLAVKYVVWYDRIWSAARAGEGWRPYVHPSGDRRNVTLRHLDHVHLSVY